MTTDLCLFTLAMLTPASVNVRASRHIIDVVEMKIGRDEVTPFQQYVLKGLGIGQGSVWYKN